MQPKRIRVGARLGFGPPVFSLLVALWLAGTSAAQEFPGREHVVGGLRGGVSCARSADLDGDGKPDAVAAIENESALAVFLGDGRGSFGAPSLFLCGEAPRFVALGDLDADGHVDAIAILSKSGFVSRLLGDGTGGLGAAALFAAGVWPSAASLGDLNADGRLDVVTLNANVFPNSGSIQVLLSNGSVGFAPPLQYVIGTPGYGAPAIADVNGDGALDVVVAGTSLPPAPQAAVFAIFEGNGTGDLMPAPDVVNRVGATAAAVFDVDADGIVDLVGSSSMFGSGIVTKLGTGGGAFAPATLATTSHSGLFPEDLKVGDLNLDGLTDAVTYISYWDLWSFPGLEVFLNVGGGAFGAGVFFVQGGAHLMSIDLVDLDLDGKLDVLLSDSNGVVAQRGDGHGSVGSIHALPRFRANASTRSLDCADMNGDGAPDLIVSDLEAVNTIDVLLGDGAAGFGAPSCTSLPVGFDPGNAVCADFDGDGQVDVAMTLTSFWGPEHEFAPNFGVEVMLGAKTGKLDAQPLIPIPVPMFRLEAGDLNLDGRLDLVATWAGDEPAALVLLSTGPKSFSAPQSLTLEPYAECVAILDADGDGILDIAAEALKAIDVWHGDGAGGFQKKLSIPVAGFPAEMRVADLNGDGRSDFVVSLGFPENDPRHLLIVPSSSSGYGPGTDLSLTTGGWGGYTYWFGIPVITTAPWLGDLDGDGHVDIALPDDFLSNVCVLRGDGAGGFSEPSWFEAGTNVSRVVGADLDGDGVVDLVGSSWNTIEITVLRGLAGAPTGVASFGAGTPGCAGVLGLSASTTPHVGAASFGWKCTNAPASSAGLLLVGDAADLAGSDALGLGVALHVDLAASSALFALACPSDAGGAAFAPAPIPNDPSLAGASFVAQALFVQPAWLACGASPFGLVSSKGTAFSITP